MGRKLGIIAAACLACALCFALAGCGGVNKAAYAGTWELESGSDDSLNADSIALMKTLDMVVTITLDEEGTGTLDLFGETVELSWDATSDAEGTVTFDEERTAKMKLVDGKLLIEDETGSTMTFAKANSAATEAGSSEAGSSDSAATEAGSSDAAATEAGSSAAASAESASAESASAEAASSEAAADEQAADEQADDEQAADEQADGNE